MGVEHAARDEDVALALDDPQQLDDRHRAAIAHHRARTAEVEDRPDQKARRHCQHQRPREEGEQRCINQCPDAEIEPGERERADRPGDGARHIGDSLRTEGDLAREKRARQRDEGCGQEQDRLHAQHVGHDRLAVIVSRQRRDQELRDGKRSVEQEEKREDLSDLPAIDLGFLHQRIRESPAVHEGESGEHHLAHREQAVIAGFE